MRRTPIWRFRSLSGLPLFRSRRENGEVGTADYGGVSWFPSSFGFENSIDGNVIQDFSGWKVRAQIGGQGISTLIRPIRIRSAGDLVFNFSCGEFSETLCA
jgi:hypothetical protein